ncbi:bifunctional peptidase and arginyl-hydroxylase JMJD5-like [Pollicipes pollicipes]|uniref:bifunctional peptidase and arginyl-hydroxylase JMJD5-like n=1 Tax=Pollicipes pollicipes TaxID=41117 RepID=UPI0018858E9D|nr:bifunctional peptidase and arginyl-hydroxylase JMJD5-like [Pollicipes pollicipes]
MPASTHASGQRDHQDTYKLQDEHVQISEKKDSKALGKRPSEADKAHHWPILSANAAHIIAAILVVILAVIATNTGTLNSDMLKKQLQIVWEKYILFWRSAPAGHGQPLGHHQPPLAEPIDVLEEFPHPEEFYRRYLKPRRPAIFRGLARLHPAFQRWTDDYLRKEFGNKAVEVEAKKKEERGKGLLDMNFAQFLSIYSKEDCYMVDSVSEEMQGDLIVPRSIQCGGLQHMLTDVVLWFSSGGTRSVLHYDELDNINCVLDGSKQFFLVDAEHEAKHEYIDHMEGRYSSVDVQHVDMYKFPGLRDVPWYNVTLEKGDCFYLPYKWPHHVRSSNTRNMAVNFWFARMLWMNQTDCAGKQLSHVTSMADFITREPASFHKADIITQAEGYEQMTLHSFAGVFSKYMTDGPNATKRAFDTLDADGDGLLDIAEMYAYDTARFLRLFRSFPMED